LTAYEGGEGASATQEEEKPMTTSQRFPNGWNGERVRRLLEHYKSQSDEEALAEDEAAFEAPKDTTMTVPVDLVPAVRELIARHRRSA
jgi:hypothetical protein